MAGDPRAASNGEVEAMLAMQEKSNLRLRRAARMLAYGNEKSALRTERTSGADI
jgi:hypothetical protein